jgi:hypothetical protein
LIATVRHCALCKNKACGLINAIASTPPEGKQAAADSEDQLAVIKCPHCWDEDMYRWSTRSEHIYTPATPRA